jgi:hypothetical protein
MLACGFRRPRILVTSTIQDASTVSGQADRKGHAYPYFVRLLSVLGGRRMPGGAAGLHVAIVGVPGLREVFA